MADINENPNAAVAPQEGGNAAHHAALGALAAVLAEVNGQDAYSTVGAAIGKLARSEWLRLPRGLAVPNTAARDVGSAATAARLAPEDFAQVYALNKAIAPVGSNAAVYGYVRARAVALGWYDGQDEVEIVEPANNAVALLNTDLVALTPILSLANSWAFLIPLAAEFVFRTTGHHYLTGQAADYDRKYATLFNASLVAPPVPALSSGVAYHSALHWVTPGRARDVLDAQYESDSIPHAIAMRRSAAPAGTAVITTTAAVIDAFSAAGLETALTPFVGPAMETIKSAAKKIRADPVAFHVTQAAYRAPARPVELVELLDQATKEACAMAWLAQGFINAMLIDSPMQHAQALKKHAHNNPVGLRRAERLFRTIARAEVKNVASLFAEGDEA